MAFGLIIRNSSGDIFYDTTVIGGNFLGTFTANANSNASFTIPHANLITTLYTQIFMINDLPTNQEALAHTISVSNGVVTATKQGNSSQSQTTQVVILGK
jgi:hypothetical protein